MFKNQSVQNILEQEVTRKQFLVHIVLSSLALIGLPTFLKNMNTAFTTQPKQSKSNMVAGGYGMSAYSGIPAKTSTSVSVPQPNVRRIEVA